MEKTPATLSHVHFGDNVIIANGTNEWMILNASLIEWIVLLVSIIVLSWLIVRIRSRFREDEGPTAQDHELLLQFRDLHRQGDLTDGEFRSIKSRIMERTDGSQDGEQPPKSQSRYTKNGIVDFTESKDAVPD